MNVRIFSIQCSFILDLSLIGSYKALEVVAVVKSLTLGIEPETFCIADYSSYHCAIAARVCKLIDARKVIWTFAIIQLLIRVLYRQLSMVSPEKYLASSKEWSISIYSNDPIVIFLRYRDPNVFAIVNSWIMASKLFQL